MSRMILKFMFPSSVFFCVKFLKISRNVDLDSRITWKVSFYMSINNEKPLGCTHVMSCFVARASVTDAVNNSLVSRGRPNAKRASCCIFVKRLGLREDEENWHLKRLCPRHLFMGSLGAQRFSRKPHHYAFNGIPFHQKERQVPESFIIEITDSPSPTESRRKEILMRNKQLKKRNQKTF